MLPQQPYALLAASQFQSLFQPVSQLSHEELRGRLIQLANLNQDLSSANQLYVNEISNLHQKISLLEAENKRLVGKLSEGEGILSRRSNRGLESITDQVKQLAERLDDTKRESEIKLSSLCDKNKDLEEEITELRTLNQNSRFKILTLQTQKSELLEKINEEIANPRFGSYQDSRFKKRDNKQQIFISSNGMTELSKQGSMSSVELINSSQESYIKEEIVQQLRYQNNLFREELILNNSKFQAQIQKLNQVINHLLSKQSNFQHQKNTISTLFNALTVSFIDFSNEVSLYQKKIVQLLEKITAGTLKQEEMKEKIDRLSIQLRILKEQCNLRK